jgi:curved DNA-binding protein CbpA
MEDLYEILGVAKDATTKEIKQAYRELSKVHHPDKGGDEEKFKEIVFAYEVLSDDERREKYDEGDISFADVTSDKEEAFNLLRSKFYDCLNRRQIGFAPEHRDLFQFMSGFIRHDIVGLQSAIEDYQIDVNRFNDIKRRIAKGDFFIAVLEDEIKYCKKKIEKTKKKIELHETALTLLEGCEYKFDDDEYLIDG